MKGFVPPPDTLIAHGDPTELCAGAPPPRQQNAYDCGVFVCAAILQLLRGCAVFWGQAQITKLRNLLLLSLCTKELQV